MALDGQFTVHLPDGVTIERLPVGRAAERWWFTFVISGTGWQRTIGPGSHRYLAEAIAVEGPGGQPLEWMSGGSGGDGDAYTFSESYRDTGLRSAVVTYRLGGREHAREDLRLPQ